MNHIEYSPIILEQHYKTLESFDVFRQKQPCCYDENEGIFCPQLLKDKACNWLKKMWDWNYLGNAATIANKIDLLVREMDGEIDSRAGVNRDPDFEMIESLKKTAELLKNRANFLCDLEHFYSIQSITDARMNFEQLCKKVEELANRSPKKRHSLSTTPPGYKKKKPKEDQFQEIFRMIDSVDWKGPNVIRLTDGNLYARVGDFDVEHLSYRDINFLHTREVVPICPNTSPVKTIRKTYQVVNKREIQTLTNVVIRARRNDELAKRCTHNNSIFVAFMHLPRRGIADVHRLVLVPTQDPEVKEQSMLMSHHKLGSLASLDLNGLSPQDVLVICRDIVVGLSEIHKTGFVHSKISPSCVLLDESPENKISAVLSEFEFSYRDFQNYTGGDTPWMAPEQIQNEFGEGEVFNGQEADMWSMGCVMYYLLYGKEPPWVEELLRIDKKGPSSEYKDEIVAVVNLMKEGFPEPQEDPLKNLCWRMLQFDPMDRTTAELALGELDGFAHRFGIT